MSASVKFLFEEYKHVKAIARNPDNYTIPKGKENNESFIKLHKLLKGTPEEIGEEYVKKCVNIAKKIDRLLYPKLKITLIKFKKDIDPPNPEKYSNFSKFSQEWKKLLNDIKETNRGFSKYFTNYMTEIYILRSLWGNFDGYDYAVFASLESSWGKFGGYNCEEELKQLLEKRLTNRNRRLRFKKIIRRCLVPLLTGLATANHIVTALFIIPLIFINEFLETSKQDEE